MGDRDEKYFKLSFKDDQWKFKHCKSGAGHKDQCWVLSWITLALQLKFGLRLQLDFHSISIA